MQTGLLYGIVANSKTRVRCVFCGVFIPKANKCIEQHANGTKHKENIELMADHGISFNNDMLYCKPCKINLEDEESVLKHIEGENHANWMAAMDDLLDGEFISLESYLTTDKEDVLCEVCNSTLLCSPQVIEQHVNGYHHRFRIAEKLKPINGIFNVDNDEELWCKVCDQYIVNSVQGILDHIDEDEHHMEWFSVIEDLIEDNDISIQEYLSNEHATKAYCNKCNMEITCDAQNIDDHVNSESHLNQFS